MILGGVPFYLNLLDRRYSLVQNIDNLFFASGGMLRTEFNELYSALFVNSERYVQIVRALTTKKNRSFAQRYYRHYKHSGQFAH